MTPKLLLLSLGYAAPAFSAAILGVLFYVYIPNLYSETYGLSLSVVGAVVFLSRVWDAVIDPLVGRMSDRTESRFGRRKVWIFISAPLLAVTFYLLCSPPLWVVERYGGFWFGLVTFLFFLFWTTLSIPYEALGTELSASYQARTVLYSVRQGVIVLGTLAAGILPAVMLTPDAGMRDGWRVIGVTCGVFLLLGVVLLACFIREPKRISGVSRDANISSLLAAARLNKPFMVLLAAFTVSGIGASLPATLIVYYVQNVLGVKDTAVYLTTYFLVGFLCLPAWVYLANRFGKREAWIWSMLVNTGAFIGVVPLGYGDEGWYLVLVALSGLGYGGTLAIPAAMQGDVLDLEAAERGERKEGEFIALWSIASKLAAAAGSGMAFPILQATGYTPGGVQHPTTLLALSLLYAAVPSACNLIAIRIARAYSLDKEQHAAVIRRLTS